MSLLVVLPALMMVGMLVFMPSVLLSTVARAGEAATRQMAWFIFVLLLLPGVIVFFTSGPSPTTVSIVLVNVTSLALGVWLGLRAAAKSVQSLMRDAEQMSAWGTANFARLDVNGDGVVCALDLTRFSKTIGLPREDLEMASRLSYMLDDVGHQVESGGKSGQVRTPKVASAQDFAQYAKKKRQLYPTWVV